jgi:hypothetical protein
VCAPFAWHLFLLRLAHRRHGIRDAGQDTREPGRDAPAPASLDPAEAPAPTAAVPVLTPSGQDAEPSRAAVRVLLAGEISDAPVSWQDVATRTGLSRSRAYTLLREERARQAAGNGHAPPSMLRPHPDQATP